MNNFNWNKKIDYLLSTDFNVDKQTHVFLYLMQKNNVFTEYILSLVKQNIEQENNILKDINLCEKIVLKEMGYEVNISLEDEEKLNEFFENIKKNLLDIKDKREEKIEKEKNNHIVEHYQLKENNIKEENENENENEVKSIHKNEEYNKKCEEINKTLEQNHSQNQALSNLCGI